MFYAAEGVVHFVQASIFIAVCRPPGGYKSVPHGNELSIISHISTFVAKYAIGKFYIEDNESTVIMDMWMKHT